MIRKICIVRLSALGDVLMLVPLVRTLQANIKDVAITWVISRPAYDLVEGMEDIDFVVIDKPNSIGDYWRFKKMMAHKSYDVLLATQSSFRANLLYPFIKAKRKIGFDALRAKDGHGWFVHERITPGKDHTLESFLKFAEPLGITKKQIVWDLPIEELYFQEMKQYIQPNLRNMIINPAASKPERSWPVERYIEVIKQVKKKWDIHIILTGGPGEFDKQLAKQISQEVAVTSLVGKTKPMQLLALFTMADIILCPDTGPSHMGAAVGTPVVALHAVTSSAVSGPYIYRHLAVDHYPEAVVKVLGTTMEKNVWGTHAHGKDTMKLVNVDEALSKISQVLNS